MKKLFNAIRAKDFDTVQELLRKQPDLVNCIAKQPPKKDDGQSPLQIALKTGNFEIAEYLMDHGANVNFMEDEASCNRWRTPALHDAINAAVMCSRWNTNDSLMGFRVFSTKENAEKSLSVLQKMIRLGADVNATDSLGNAGLTRFCLAAKQILPSYDYANDQEGTDRVFTEEVHADLKAVLVTLRDAGADAAYIAPNFGRPVCSYYQKGSLAILLNEVFGA